MTRPDKRALDLLAHLEFRLAEISHDGRRYRFVRSKYGHPSREVMWYADLPPISWRVYSEAPRTCIMTSVTDEHFMRWLPSVCH